MPGLSDQELLLLYKQQEDADIVAELYGRYMELLYAVCLKYFKDRENARDAVLQVFEKLPIQLKSHKPENFRAWIYTVVKNHCLMQLRKNATVKVIAIDDTFMQFVSEEHPADRNGKEFQLNRLSECIQKLSGEQKKSIELFYLKEKCYKEIVGITGLEFNKVRSLIQNGKRNLKICMEKNAVE